MIFWMARVDARLERIEQRQISSMQPVSVSDLSCMDELEQVALKSVEEVQRFELRLAEQSFRHKIVNI